MKKARPVESPALRRKTMQAVKSKDTAPEYLVRSVVHAAGYRYRLHRRDLPGCPDLVFAGRRKVIFVHGCFWHGHDCPRGARVPKSNTAYWTTKVARNRERDARAARRLRAHGWGVLTLWECKLRNRSTLLGRIARFLES